MIGTSNRKPNNIYAHLAEHARNVAAYDIYADLVASRLNLLHASTYVLSSAQLICHDLIER